MSFLNRMFGAGSGSSGSSSQPHVNSAMQFPPTPAQPAPMRYGGDVSHARSPSVPATSTPVSSVVAAASLPRWELLGDEALAAAHSNPFRDASVVLPVSAQPCARTYFTAVEYQNRMYVFGGFGDASKGRFSDLRAWDHASGTWELLDTYGDVPKPVYLHSAVVYKDEMWVFGGSVGRDCNDLTRYHFQSRRWTRVAPTSDTAVVPAPRYGHAACVVGERMIISGGCKQNNEYFADAYSYHFPTNVWRRIADIPLDMAYHSLVAHQERALCLGGYNGIKFNNSIYSYAVDESAAYLPTEWRVLPVTVNPASAVSSSGTRGPPPFCGAAVCVAQDSCFVFAGYTAAGHANDLYKLNLRTNEWSVVNVAQASRPAARAYLQAVVSPRDGHLTIFGGFDGTRCVTDFKRIVVAELGEVNLVAMLRDLPVKTVAKYALQRFSKQTTAAPKLDEAQLEAVLQNLRHHLPPPVQEKQAQSLIAPPASAGSSSLSSASAAFYPFDTSRLSDLMELGFPRDTCLECLEAMFTRKEDTHNFEQVVDRLLNFTSERDPPPPPPENTAALARHAATTMPPPTPKRATSTTAATTASPAAGDSSEAVLPPSSNASSLQEQVHRLTEENKEIKSCKVCFEAVIDCVLIPCGHLVVCSACAETMKQHGHECPSGRCAIQSHMKVFWS